MSRENHDKPNTAEAEASQLFYQSILKNEQTATRLWKEVKQTADPTKLEREMHASNITDTSIVQDIAHALALVELSSSEQLNNYIKIRMTQHEIFSRIFHIDAMQDFLKSPELADLVRKANAIREKLKSEPL